LPAPAPAIDQALGRLLSDGVVRRRGAEHDPELSTDNLVIPLGAERGWEAAVLDHFSAVAAAIAAKVRHGPGAREGDVLGGGTFTFDVYKGHPFEQPVLALLGRVRRDVDALWEQVASYNRSHPVPESHKTTVSFYVGQSHPGRVYALVPLLLTCRTRDLVAVKLGQLEREPRAGPQHETVGRGLAAPAGQRAEAARVTGRDSQVQ
jgi:hypothetical protein